MKDDKNYDYIVRNQERKIDKENNYCSANPMYRR